VCHLLAGLGPTLTYTSFSSAFDVSKTSNRRSAVVAVITPRSELQFVALGSVTISLPQAAPRYNFIYTAQHEILNLRFRNEVVKKAKVSGLRIFTRFFTIYYKTQSLRVM